MYLSKFLSLPIILILILLPKGTAFAQEPGNDRESRFHAPDSANVREGQDKFGFGFGGAFGAQGTLGLLVKADYNFLFTPYGHSQVHLMSSWSNLINGSFFSSNVNGTSISLNANRSAITYRWVLNSGFYLGAGFGKTTGNLTYKIKGVSWEPIEKRRTFTFDSTFIPLDIGWLGTDGYYFSFGVQPSNTLKSRSSYREDELPDNPPRLGTLRSFNRKAKDSTIGFVEFGWYIL